MSELLMARDITDEDVRGRIVHVQLGVVLFVKVEVIVVLVSLDGPT